MAVDFKGIDYKRGSVYRFDPKHIKIVPNLCARHEPPNEEKIKWLMNQFLDPAIGQIEPIFIRRDGKDSPPILIAGHRRWEAATRINQQNLTPVPFLLDCVYQEVNESEGFKIAVQENIREATTPWDDAYNIRTLTKLCGMDTAAIAALYGEEESWVKSRLELISLGPECFLDSAKPLWTGSKERSDTRVEDRGQERR